MWSQFCCKVWKLVTYFVFVLFCLFNCLFSSSGVYVSYGNRESTSRLIQIIQTLFKKACLRNPTDTEEANQLAISQSWPRI